MCSKEFSCIDHRKFHMTGNKEFINFDLINVRMHRSQKISYKISRNNFI